MSFFEQPHSSNPDMESALEEETEREFEERAARYSELHPDGPEPTILTKLAGRLRRLLGRGK
jgi:hypothetical protein